MKVYRLAHKRYMHDTSGAGAKKWGGRWNPPGIACIYTSQNLSLAMLEKLVHAQAFNDVKDVALMVFDIENTADLYRIDTQKLQPGWKENVAYTQWMGKQIMENGSFKGFVAPSIIIPEEMNVILLPNFQGKACARLISAEEYIFDSRLSRFLPK